MTSRSWTSRKTVLAPVVRLIAQSVPGWSTTNKRDGWPGATVALSGEVSPLAANSSAIGKPPCGLIGANTVVS